MCGQVIVECDSSPHGWGFGRIRDTKLTPAGGAVDSAIYHNGRVLRSLPSKFAPVPDASFRYERRTVRPPYWHAANQAMAVPPFEDVPKKSLADGLNLGEVTVP